jgi:creatinine amidohydrolase
MEGTAMSVYFAEKSWPELKDYIERNALVIVPFGTLEEHGLHLPVNTDTAIAEGVALCVAEAARDRVPVLVMPVFWSGYSIKKMTKWPGVIRIRTEILTEVFFDLLSSLVEMGFKKILCLNGHGQNPEMIKLASRRIADKYDVHIVNSNYYSLAAETMKRVRKSGLGGALHGGEFETSLMLYLTDLVDMGKATKDDVMKYRSDFYPGDMFGSAAGGTFLSTWYVQESKTGIYGDPTVATRETGKLLVDGIVKKYLLLIDEYMNL